MQHDDDPPKKNVRRLTPAEAREQRLKDQLRANLARRKQQARARRDGAEDSRPGALILGNELDGE